MFSGLMSPKLALLALSLPGLRWQMGRLFWYYNLAASTQKWICNSGNSQICCCNVQRLQRSESILHWGQGDEKNCAGGCGLSLSHPCRSARRDVECSIKGPEKTRWCQTCPEPFPPHRLQKAVEPRQPRRIHPLQMDFAFSKDTLSHAGDKRSK